MKILMVLESFFPPDERVENEINILTDKGFEITLVCTHRGSKFHSEEAGNLKILRIPVSTCIYKSSALALVIPIYFLFWYIHLNSIIKKLRFDAIHLHDLPLVKVGLRLSKKYKIPLVCDYHENRPEIMKMYSHVQKFPGKCFISIKQWLKYQLKYTKKADRLILVTEEARDYYISNYYVNPEKVTVLPNYISLKRFSMFNIIANPESHPKECFTAIYFGDTGIRRGTQTVLESAALLKGSSVRFLIIGDSRDQSYLKTKADEWKLSNVTFTGRLSVAEALTLINKSDAGLCPFLRNIHHDTTYANKMFQYMALGKPVIVSNCIAQANFVERESCGLVFEAGNPGDLASKIVSLTDREAYRKLSRRAINCVNGNHNWETTGSRLIEMYLKGSLNDSP